MATPFEPEAEDRLRAAEVTSLSHPLYNSVVDDAVKKGWICAINEVQKPGQSHSELKLEANLVDSDDLIAAGTVNDARFNPLKVASVEPPRDIEQIAPPVFAAAKKALMAGPPKKQSSKSRGGHPQAPKKATGTSGHASMDLFAAFEHVSCAIENAQLRPRLDYNEQLLKCQEKSLRDALDERRVEVSHLSEEVMWLRTALNEESGDEEEDLLAGDQKQVRMANSQAQAERARCDAEKALSDLTMFQVEAAKVRETSRDANRDIAELRAKISVFDELRRLERAEVKSWFSNDTDARRADLEWDLRQAGLDSEKIVELRTAERERHEMQMDGLVKELRAARVTARRQKRASKSPQMSEKSLPGTAECSPEAICPATRAMRKACSGVTTHADAVLQLFAIRGSADAPSGDQASEIHAVAEGVASLTNMLQSRVDPP